MLGKQANSQFVLTRQHQKVTKDLAELNRELAAQMILLAAQTGDTEPLIKAISALQKADSYFSSETTPRETAEVRQALADTLYTLAKAKDDVNALEHAIDAYRSAITLASLIGDQDMRKKLKTNYGLARNLLGDRGTRHKTQAA